MLSAVQSRSRGRKSLLIWTLLAPSTYKYAPPPKFADQIARNPRFFPLRRRTRPPGAGHVRPAPPRPIRVCHVASHGARLPGSPSRLPRRPPGAPATARLRRPAPHPSLRLPPPDPARIVLPDLSRSSGHRPLQLRRKLRRTSGSMPDLDLGDKVDFPLPEILLSPESV